MSLEEVLIAIRHGIESNIFINEASVSQGIVLRLLNALSWEIHDPLIVSPEYQLKGRRVDFALCHPVKKPIIFIEVKQIGQSDNAEEQLFNYAYHEGVPFAILTDGREWNFFLPGEQGSYDDRRVYKLDLLERDIEECVYRLNRYLSYESILNEKALPAAREDYRNTSKNRIIETNFPSAWTKILEEGNGVLLELIADKVESICGYKPSFDQVKSFLKSMSLEEPAVNIKKNLKEFVLSKPQVINSKTNSKEPNQKMIGFRFEGRSFETSYAIELLKKTFEVFSRRDKHFFQKFAELDEHGKKRRYLSKNIYELYPGKDINWIREHSVEISSGWWLGTNYGQRQIEDIVIKACEVAGVRFKKDYQIIYKSK